MSAKTTGKMKPATAIKPPQTPVRPLLTDVRQMILQARESVARAIDSGLTMLYWHVGLRVRQDILKDKRANYGEEIVSALRRQLTWTHFKSLIYLEDPLKRNFYSEMCRQGKWDVRTLRNKIVFVHKVRYKALVGSLLEKFKVSKREDLDGFL